MSRPVVARSSSGASVRRAIKRLSDAIAATAQGYCLHSIGSLHVTLESLITRYFRLQQDLTRAHSHRPWQSGLIDDLAHQLGAIERQILAMRALELVHGGTPAPT